MLNDLTKRGWIHTAHRSRYLAMVGRLTNSLIFPHPHHQNIKIENQDQITGDLICLKSIMPRSRPSL
jgi:hypothetical protein